MAGRNVRLDHPENVQFLLQNAAVKVKVPVKMVVQGRPFFEDRVVHVVLVIAQVVDVVVVDGKRVPGVQFDVKGGQDLHGVVEGGKADAFQLGEVCSCAVKNVIKYIYNRRKIIIESLLILIFKALIFVFS